MCLRSRRTCPSNSPQHPFHVPDRRVGQNAVAQVEAKGRSAKPYRMSSTSRSAPSRGQPPPCPLGQIPRRYPPHPLVEDQTVSWSERPPAEAGTGSSDPRARKATPGYSDEGERVLACHITRSNGESGTAFVAVVCWTRTNGESGATFMAAMCWRWCE